MNQVFFFFFSRSGSFALTLLQYLYIYDMHFLQLCLMKLLFDKADSFQEIPQSEEPFGSVIKEMGEQIYVLTA